VAGVVIVIVGGVGVYVASFLSTNKPETYTRIDEHFKYGSIGSEERGVPYEIWKVLPTVFEDLLPKDGHGKGYERIGFTYEKGHERPIGTTYRERPIGIVGLNCAVCHTSTVRENKNAPANIVLGMPGNHFRLEHYINFLRAVGRDKRFTAGTLIPAIKKASPDLSMRDELLYRHYVIPRTRRVLRQVDDDFAWLDRRPPEGPGRVDTFNPYKTRFGQGGPEDKTVGTVDLPPLWNQGPREGMYLHWDGNNNSLLERNISAAIGAGSEPKTLDEPSLARIREWSKELQPPKFPSDRIDQPLVARGEEIYRDSCAQCHDLGSSGVGRVTEIDEVGTDRDRLDSFTPELVKAMNTLGEGKPWRFRHFRKTNGYANMPLDGLWLRAPYLHNGSVPDMRALLAKPQDRPTVFFRDYDVYDFDRLGFVTRGPDAERVGWRFDTTVRGNGNGGHMYGTDLTDEEKDALIEYLKTK
jgi:mono/diheme cytochrome c family protein